MWQVAALDRESYLAKNADADNVQSFLFPSRGMALAVAGQWAEQGLVVTLSFTAKVKK